MLFSFELDQRSPIQSFWNAGPEFDGMEEEAQVSYKELSKALSGFLTAIERQHNSVREAASTYPPDS
jgi:hypothetical protein